MPAAATTYEIHEVARLTGLATARLRAWERRYEVVRPVRQPNGYRLYTAEQVALLRAFARLIETGERIGDLALRPREEVVAWAEACARDAAPQAALLGAARALDRDRLELLLTRQLADRGLRGFATDVVLPLARSIGDLWALGQLRVAAEHLASEAVLHVLKNALRGPASGPLVVAACLAGERHELGLLAALAVLHEAGWRTEYLGADLPVREAADVGRSLAARCVAFSGSDPAVVRANLPALALLPERLPPHTLVAVGGRGTEPHARVLRRHGILVGSEVFGPVARA
jgi:DNA-binding transcriptional MerR regulator